jgi:hypothetical protein
VPHLSWRGGYEAGSNIETGALLDERRNAGVDLAGAVSRPEPRAGHAGAESGADAVAGEPDRGGRWI